MTHELSVHEIRERTGHLVIDGDGQSQFRDFTFANAARFYGGGEPGFFDGTVIEEPPVAS